MKKLLFALIAVFSCSFAFGTAPEKIDNLSSKVVFDNARGYFVLSDGTCFKTYSFVKRWRGLLEWWNDVQLVPENYESTPSDWYLGTEIAVYPKHGNLDVSELDASNKDQLKQCTHLLVNTRTGQVLFAIALHPADCVVQLYHEAKKYGYDEGYTKGRSEGDKNQANAYERGYTDGKNDGYSQGSSDASNGSSDSYNRGHSMGYTEGYNDGYEAGNLVGYNEGYDVARHQVDPNQYDPDR